MPDHDDGLHFTHPSNVAPHTKGGPPKPKPIECTCVHAPEHHEDGTGSCLARLYDSLGTYYADCSCPWYEEAK